MIFLFQNRKVMLLLLLSFCLLLGSCGLYYVYAATSISYTLDEIEMECLFSSEQEILNKISISVENDEIPEIDTNNVEIILEDAEKITLNSVNNIKIVELEEEFYVNNKLSARNIENEIGSSSETDDAKYFRIFGSEGINKRGRCQYYSGPSEAIQDMVSFKIQVWSLNSNNDWYKRTVYMQTHKNIEKTVKCIFSDLLDLPESKRTPIKTIGCYNYRTGSSCHTCGVAIDINWEENAEMTNSGIITAGSYWRPYEDIYSIAPDSEMVKIFAKYGFGWGGFWTSKKDYMHFSYFNR